ncbi:spore germination protein [Paenibacillus chibensis]|uniref:spore germination protein n=1 Tax=Paenibacillus chibensis TaxID=59846 RepID=UPI0013E4062A|nr:spore germination protein [Paenibacillus chibensis]MEC0373199.1 spore germination protein [Paenibacillus chibensis]
MINLFKHKWINHMKSSTQKGTPDTQPLNEQALLQQFQMCRDVKHHVYKLVAGDDQSSIVLLYCDGLCDNQQLIQDVVLPHLTRFYENHGFHKNQELLESSQLQLESISFEEWEQKRTFSKENCYCLFRR